MTTNAENLDRIGHAMMLAWSRVKKSQSRMWGEWMTIGEGLLEGRNWAMRQADTNKPEGKGYVMAYAEWLKRYKVDDMDKSDRAKLLQIMEERPGVEEWRAGLPPNERRTLNNPVVVWRKWTAATRVKKPKPRAANVSGTEYGRAQDMVQQQAERIKELEEELAAAPVTADELLNKLVELLKPASREQQKKMVTALRVGLRLSVREWMTTFPIGKDIGKDAIERPVPGKRKKARRTPDDFARETREMKAAEGQTDGSR